MQTCALVAPKSARDTAKRNAEAKSTVRILDFPDPNLIFCNPVFNRKVNKTGYLKIHLKLVFEKMIANIRYPDNHQGLVWF
jgi:hypothetical protein